MWVEVYLKQGLSSQVSREFLYGTCADLWFKDANTSPSALRLLLMFCASFRRSPVAPERDTRSLPAKSTRWRQPDKCVVAAPMVRLAEMLSENT